MKVYPSSSNIDYYEIINESTLNIMFLSGDLYQYYDVDKFILDEIGLANSFGSYFYYNIRGKYRYAKI